MGKRLLRYAAIFGVLTILWIALDHFLLRSFLGEPRLWQSAKWMLNSDRYKREVLAQSASSMELKHIEWDGWGFGGNNTVIYLVFDPQNALVGAVRNGARRNFQTCGVERVRRLENHWYTVRYYTGYEWRDCPLKEW